MATKKKKKVKVVFELVKVLHDADWLGSGEPYYRATVNVSDTGKSKVYSSDEVPGNVLDGKQFTKEVEVDDDPNAKINVSFRGWDKDVFFDDSLGEVKRTVSASKKQSFVTTSDTGNFVLFWRVEPTNYGVATVPGPISVSRQHHSSTTFTTLAGDRVEIGVLVRGCWGESHEPPIGAQHADVTLPDATRNHRILIGFFAEPSAATFRGKTLSGTIIGPELHEYRGIVYKNLVMKAKREWYYNASVARAKKVVSLFCKLEILAGQAKMIIDTWKKWETSPPNFIAFGKNCSSRAASSLASGYVVNHIEGLDTPYNLYKTLKKIYGSRLRCEAGYMGFDSNGEYKKIFDIGTSEKPSNKEASSIDSLQ